MQKGIMNLKLTAQGASGHASMPPRQTAVGALAEAVASLEKHQMKPEWNYATKNMFAALSPRMKGAFKLLFSNLWLFSGLIKKVLAGGRASAALVRTTFAPTMLEASNAPNVLADSASCVFSIRIAPGKTDKDVFEHVEKNTSGIKRDVIYYYPPSPVSSVETDAYRDVMAAVRDAFPEMAAAPYPVVAATDSRHYYNICDNVSVLCRFPP
jgi:carboxypeptidase PM20D1